MVIRQVGGDVGLSEGERVVEGERRLDVVILVLVVVAEARVHGREQEVPAQLGRIRAARVVLARIALDREGDHPGI